MKKIIVLVTALFLLVGCNNTMNSPTKEVENLLSKYQKNDEEIVKQFDTSLFEEENLTEEQKQKYKEIMLDQYKNLTYKILEEKVDGNTATVEVEVEVYDYTKSLNNSYAYLENNRDQFYVDDVLDVVLFIDYKLEQLMNAKDRIKYNIVFKLERENSKSEWNIKELSEIDLKKIHGIYAN